MAKAKRVNRKSNGGPKNRPMPLIPRAGFRVDGKRYGKGGKVNK